MSIPRTFPPTSGFITEQSLPYQDDVQVLQQTLAKVILGTANPIETYDSVLVLQDPY